MDTESPLAVIKHQPGATVVVVAGEIDLLTAPRLAAVLTDAIKQTTAELVVADLSEVRFLGAVGIRILSTAHQRSIARGVRLCLVAGSGTAVTRVLRITQLDAAIPIYPSLDHVPGLDTATPEPRT